MNSKNAASNYLKSDNQTMWSRNAANGTAGGQRKRTPISDAGTTPAAPAPEVEVISLSIMYFSQALILRPAPETWVRLYHHPSRHTVSSRRPGYRRVSHQYTSCYSSKNHFAIPATPFIHQSYPSFQENSVSSSSNRLA